MKSKKFLYNFDMDYEMKTYKHIGNDYGDRKTADQGLIHNITRYIRKKRNKNNKDYMRCDTYTEWKIYLKDKYKKSISINFQKYLNLKRKDAKRTYDVFVLIFIPIEAAILTIYLSIQNKAVSIWSLLFIGIFCCVYFSLHLYELGTKIDFLEDCMEVLSSETKNQNV